MISEKMQDALNKQIELEAFASFTYLSMASWCEKEGLEGSAQFLYRQADEERAHMMKLFNYLIEVDGRAIVPAIPQPPSDFDSIANLFEEVLNHEKKVTASIHKLVRLSVDENDYTTHNFLQWYVSEQREEEATVRGILDKIKLIGNNPSSSYYIDKELEIINQQSLPPQQ